MAEGGFESYLHVPQQTRKDKLRVFMAQNQHHPLASPPPPPFLPDLQGRSKFFPPYDLSLPSSSGLLPPNYNSLSLSAVTSTVEPAAVKGQTVSNINTKPHTSMGLLGGVINATSSTSSSSSSPSASPNYLDSQVLQVQPSFPMNPSSVHQGHINNSYNNPFLYTSNHNLQNLNTCSGEVVVFKPELLSLSLSSHYDNNAHHQNQPNLPLELDLRRYGPAIYDDMVTWSGGYMVVPSGSTSNEVSTSYVPLGPFTGYASILKESKFLKPAQQLLEELFCSVGGGERSSFDVSVMDPPIDQCLSDIGLVDDPLISGKKSKLILMLEEVYKRDKQYYQQIQAVVASFECVAGLGNAAPYANLALKATSKHFKSLKNAIADQLQPPSKAYGQLSHGKEAVNFGNIDRGPGGQRLVQGLGFAEQRPVWRPQRGLPERAVAVLRTWLFEHFLHPYPTDRDKLMLAKQTGLTRNQVSNWFINARVRLWKPMVDEIHKLETQQAHQKDSERDQELNASGQSNQLIGSNSNALSNSSIPTPRISDVTWKYTRNELPDLHGGEKPLNFSYNNLSSHPPTGVAVSVAGGSSGVSLTLGLHQNNGLGLSEPFSIGAADHIGHGLEANSEGYVMGGPEAQNRQFGRDVIGGQLFT